MTVIIVLGGHRSGTSAVAGVCHELGLFMGQSLIGKSRDNARGHFEDVEFVALNKAIVGDWRRPMADFEPANVARQVPPLKKLLETRQKLVELQTKVDLAQELPDKIEELLTDADKIAAINKQLGGQSEPEKPQDSQGGE